MLYLGTDARLAFLDSLERALLATVFHRLDPAALGRDLPAQPLTLNAGLGTGVTSIGMDHLFLAVQQLLDLLDIGLVRRCRRHRVYQTGVGVHANVRLHPEVPLIALLRLVHLRIALTLRVLGRTRRRDDRRVHNAAALEQQA